MQPLEFHLQEHLGIAKALGDRAGELRAFSNLGIVFHQSGLSETSRGGPL